LPDLTDWTKGAVTTNKKAGFGVSMPDHFDYLQMKKKKEYPCPTQYFLENDDNDYLLSQLKHSTIDQASNYKTHDSRNNSRISMARIGHL